MVWVFKALQWQTPQAAVSPGLVFVSDRKALLNPYSKGNTVMTPKSGKCSYWLAAAQENKRACRRKKKQSEILEEFISKTSESPKSIFVCYLCRTVSSNTSVQPLPLVRRPRLACLHRPPPAHQESKECHPTSGQQNWRARRISAIFSHSLPCTSSPLSGVLWPKARPPWSSLDPAQLASYQQDSPAAQQHLSPRTHTASLPGPSHKNKQTNSHRVEDMFLAPTLPQS